HVMTMGIVAVASLAARVGDGPEMTITSNLRRTSSAASAGRRSGFPSAYRYSMTMFFPSTYPRSRRPWRNASRRVGTLEGKVVLKNPIREIFGGCCASAGWMEPRRKTVSNQESFLFMDFVFSQQRICHKQEPMKIVFL